MTNIMTNELAKMQELAHYSVEVMQKISEFAESMRQANLDGNDMLENALLDLKGIMTRNETSVEDAASIAFMMETIQQFATQSLLNFQMANDLLSWSDEKTNKFVEDYQDLANRLGY
ncbi:hypothetical protein HUK80_15660 [Flavobacterium sp. MAH-1]|uniref:Phasin protein n=1 Tax=Flavobacterium agri TaxID=2743471 RepID=A0A7Y8Y715_9FLAO|nr:hypothetical protein [Flavobacterium agri]NUY82341.1 hypothetical protein [Flavobacterium agri]NYA72365.1 hypothetical protein [Flavobacterium agri]